MMRGIACLLALALLSGCISGAAPPPAPEPAAAPATSTPVVQEPTSAGLFTADSDGRLEAAPSLPGWTVRPEGGWTIDVTQVLEPERLTLYLVQALVPQRATVRIDADVQVDPPVPVGERPRSHGTCFYTQAWPTAQGSFFLDRLRGLDPRAPEQMDDGAGRGTAHSEWWLMNLGGSYTVDDFDSMDLAQDEWLVLSTGISQVTPEEAAAGQNRWDLTVELEGPHRVIALPGAPFYCLMGLKSMPGVEVDPFDVAFDGDLRFQSPYGAALEFRPFKEPSLYLVGPRCTPIGAHEGVATFNGEVVPLTKETELARWTYDRADVQVQVTEWGCQSMQWLAVVGMPHPLAGTWWTDSWPRE